MAATPAPEKTFSGAMLTTARTGSAAIGASDTKIVPVGPTDSNATSPAVTPTAGGVSPEIGTVNKTGGTAIYPVKLECSSTAVTTATAGSTSGASLNIGIVVASTFAATGTVVKLGHVCLKSSTLSAPVVVTGGNSLSTGVLGNSTV